MKNKLNEFVLLRALAILGVVLYHSVSELYNLNMQNKNLNYVFFDLFMYLSLNMAMIPLFVFISGYLFAYTSQFSTKNFSQIVTDKAKRLLLPYIVFAVLFEVMSPYTGFSNFSISVFLINIIKGSDHLWYLLMLFNCFLLFALFKRNKFFFVLIPLMYLYYVVMEASPYSYFNKLFSFKGLIYFFPWFSIGYLVFKFFDRITFISKKALLLSVFFIYILYVSINAFNSQIWAGFFDDYKSYFAQLLAVVLVWMFCRNIKFNEQSNFFKKISQIDKLSFGIYIFHTWIIHMLLQSTFLRGITKGVITNHPIYCIFPVFIVSISISIFLTNLLRRAYLGRHLLGES